MRRGGSNWSELVAAVLTSLVAGAAAAQTVVPTLPAPSPSPALRGGTPDTPRVGVRSEDGALEQRYAARLLALTPRNAEGYFLLAEEVADGAAADVSRRRLATRLYVLAYELDRGTSGAGGGGRAIAASACLGLADVARGKRDRQFLESLARSLDPRQAPPGWVEATEIATSDSAGYRLAVLLGEVRSGEGLRARRILEDPDVDELLERYDLLLERAGFANGAYSVRREAERWPCPECRNARVVRKLVAGEVEYRVCPVCGGMPGPKLTTGQLLGQLRFEAWLLQGKQRSWASQMGMDNGAPLVDPDPAKLGVLFGVDTDLVLWRDGLWMADPNAVKVEEKAPESGPEPDGGAKAPESSPASAGS